jgi:hypothetical protein
MVLLFQCKYRCVKLNMLKLAPKTEQDSNGTFHQGAFLLPRWPPGHLKAHICFDRCGFFCSLLSIKKSFRIGGSQIEENENPSNSAASGAGYPVQAQAFAAQSGLQHLPVCVMMSMMFCQPAYAATDVWTKAKEIMQDVYTQILAISTIAAIVTASVALLLMNFSRSGRTVDESRAWLKRICITWAILNGLGFIMAYVTPLFSGGQWTG